jgi:hypothetical protein
VNITTRKRVKSQRLKKPATPPSRDHRYRQLIEPLAHWTTFGLKLCALLGTLIGWAYYKHIGYFPVDNASSLGALAVLLALFSLAMFCSLAVLWGTPISVIVGARRTPFWSCLFHHFMVAHPKDATPYPPRNSGCAFLFAFLMITGVWMIITLSQWHPPGGLEAHEWNKLFWFFIDAVVVMACWYVWRQHSAVGWLGPMPNATKRHRLWRVIFLLIFVFSAIYPMAVFFTLVRTTGIAQTLSDLEIFLLMTGCMGIMSLSCGFSFLLATDPPISDSQQRRDRWLHLSMGLVFLVVTLLLLGFFPYLPTQVMRLASVRIPQAHIALTEEACQALQLAGIAPLVTDKTTTLKTCLLKNVLVLSRLGDQWRIACGSSADFEKNAQAFNVDGKQIRYWSATSESPPKHQNICTKLP